MCNFYKKWRSEPFKQSDKFPYIMGLGTNTMPKSLLLFDSEETANSEIVITEAYEKTYNHILNLRGRGSEANTGGVVLTGQPGIGMSLMLVR